jgi:orotidine-5'-phosphate decarboxylase
MGASGYSGVGAVVGATYPQQISELRKIMPTTYFLVPGYGAQGGKAEDVARAFNSDGLGAIINASRSIMCAYKKAGAPEADFAKAAREEALRMKNDIIRFL